MDQQSIIRKIGDLLEELQEQYSYLSEAQKSSREVEIALFSASAAYLADCARLLEKLEAKSSQVSGLSAAPMPKAGAEEKLFEEDEKALHPAQPGSTGAGERESSFTFENPRESETFPQYKIESKPLAGEDRVAREEPVAGEESIGRDEPIAREKPVAREELPAREEPLRPVVGEASAQPAPVSPGPAEPDFSRRPEQASHEPMKTQDRPDPKPSEDFSGRTFPEEGEKELSAGAVSGMPEEATGPVSAPGDQAWSPEKSNNAPRSLNERFQAQRKSLYDRMVTREPAPSPPSPITKLSGSLGINERYYFIKNLFHDDKVAFDQAITRIDMCSSLGEALEYVNKTLAGKYHWSRKEEDSRKFYDLLKRRFT